MTTVFMHIGMNKAGSSSIQASLKDYDDGHVRYARLGPRNHSAPIVAMFSQNPQDSKLLRRGRITPAAGERALADELALGRSTLVISDTVALLRPVRATRSVRVVSGSCRRRRKIVSTLAGGCAMPSLDYRS